MSFRPFFILYPIFGSSLIPLTFGYSAESDCGESKICYPILDAYSYAVVKSKRKRLKQVCWQVCWIVDVEFLKLFCSNLALVLCCVKPFSTLNQIWFDIINSAGKWPPKLDLSFYEVLHPTRSIPPVNFCRIILCVLYCVLLCATISILPSKRYAVAVGYSYSKWGLCHRNLRTKRLCSCIHIQIICGLLLVSSGKIIGTGN